MPKFGTVKVFTFLFSSPQPNPSNTGTAIEKQLSKNNMDAIVEYTIGATKGYIVVNFFKDDTDFQITDRARSKMANKGHLFDIKLKEDWKVLKRLED